MREVDLAEAMRKPAYETVLLLVCTVLTKRHRRLSTMVFRL